MCGIAGFSGFSDKKLLKEMTTSLAHRGPDQHNYYTDDFASLGHRRLSIIDLSEKGKQPLCNEEETILVVFNGEIYNYKELKIDLEQKGHRFSSATDTEVLVHGYEEYGKDFVKQLNGDFAFAIYDSTKKTLFLARDRLGIKPLYYTFVNGHFYFASEIKALLQSDEIKREVNLSALNYYLTFYANPMAETMFKGIYKLLPGHSLTFSKGKISISKYWDLSYTSSLSNQTQAQEQLYSLLFDSVQRRLMSDVPLGVYLSGGIDSGSVVALMSKMTDNIKTFSVGFEGIQSELSSAKITADHFNTNHQEIHLDFSAIKKLPEIVYHQDEPMGDPTSIPTYFLSQEAKKKCTVVLTGEGADEQFAGYEQEKFMLLHQKYLQKIPLGLRKSLSTPLQKIPAKAFSPLFSYMKDLGEEGKKRLVQFVQSDDPTKNILSMISLFDEEEKKEVAGPSLKKELSAHSVQEHLSKHYFAKTTKQTLLNDLLYFENKVPLAENLLMKVDKNTMAHAIEARVPFLDHRVVEFAATLDPSLKIHGGINKFILRQTMKNHLPPQKHNQKKQRFFVPIHHWLKDDLGPLSGELFDQKRIVAQGFFNHETIQKLILNYNQSPLFYGRQLWTLLNFQIWHKTFIEEEKVRI